MASKDARVKALMEEINSLNLKYENSVKVSDVLVYFVCVCLVILGVSPLLCVANGSSPGPVV